MGVFKDEVVAAGAVEPSGPQRLCSGWSGRNARLHCEDRCGWGTSDPIGRCWMIRNKCKRATTIVGRFSNLRFC